MLNVESIINWVLQKDLWINKVIVVYSYLKNIIIFHHNAATWITL